MFDDHHGQTGVADVHAIGAAVVADRHRNAVGDRPVHYCLAALYLLSVGCYHGAFGNGKGGNQLVVVQIGDGEPYAVGADGGRLLAHTDKLAAIFRRRYGGLQLLVEYLALIAGHGKLQRGYGRQCPHIGVLVVVGLHLLRQVGKVEG